MDLLSLLGIVVLNVASWTPVDVAQFWVEPDQTSVFAFDANPADSAENMSRSESVAFEFKTTDGEFFCRGEGVVEGKRLLIEATLPQGYFELELPETGQTFGVASQPAHCPNEALLATEASKRNDLRQRDPFFGIDAASTWLVHDNQAREDLIRNARRIGIATYRERVSWGRIEKEEGVFDFEGDGQSEFVRKTAQKYDVPVLELFHNSPTWMERVGTYPVDLIKTANSWGVISKNWEQYWNSIEVWNEPDISFSGNLPADQYVPVLKAVAQEMERQGVDTPVVGGVIASFRDDFMDCLADNGMLDACDIFSFHTYCRAYDMENVSLRYHNWLVKNKAEWKPVWITECGRPWKKGTNRPDREADLESAIDIVQKGVATKALGIDAYFPFVYVYYEENDNNFGMCDRNNAPLRSSAAYARSIYLLSGANCIGSWDIDGVERSYVFVDSTSEQKVAVLYSRNREPGRTLQLPVKPLYVERATGERLNVGTDNSVDYSDGFLFVGVTDNVELSLREANEVDKARRLRHAANIKHGADPRRNFSVALRYAYDPEQVTVNGGGYSIINSALDTFRGKIAVYNFDEEAKDFPISVKAFVADEDGKTVEAKNVIKNVVQTVSVPARGCAEFGFELDVTSISPFNAPTLQFQVGDEGILSFKMARSITEKSFESAVTSIVSVDLSELSKWRKSASKNHRYEFKTDLEKTNYWGFDIEFDEGDKWAYPVFKLPIETSLDGVSYLNVADRDGNAESYKLSQFKGVAFAAKASSDVPDGVVRVFFHNEKGEYYFTASGVMKTDGTKQFIVVSYESLNAYGGTPDSFDPSKIRAVSIGGNSKGMNLTLEVEKFCFFK